MNRREFCASLTAPTALLLASEAAPATIKEKSERYGLKLDYGPGTLLLGVRQYSNRTVWWAGEERAPLYRRDAQWFESDNICRWISRWSTQVQTDVLFGRKSNYKEVDYADKLRSAWANPISEYVIGRDKTAHAKVFPHGTVYSVHKKTTCGEVCHAFDVPAYQNKARVRRTLERLALEHKLGIPVRKSW